jgi:hypothetical protein
VESPLIVHGAAAHIHPVESLNSHLDAPERVSAPQRVTRYPEATLAKVASHVFLGNLSEYEVALSSGLVLRVQTHPLQQFKVGDPVAIAIDATQCSAFPRIR